MTGIEKEGELIRQFMKTEKFIENPQRYEVLIRAMIVFNDLRTSDVLLTDFAEKLEPGFQRTVIESFLSRVGLSQAFEAKKLLTDISKSEYFADVLDNPVVKPYFDVVKNYITEEHQPWPQPLKGIRTLRHCAFSHYDKSEIADAVPRLAGRGDYDCAFADIHTRWANKSIFYYAEGILTEIIAKGFDITSPSVDEANVEIAAAYEKSSWLRVHIGDFLYYFIIHAGKKDAIWSDLPPEE